MSLTHTLAYVDAHAADYLYRYGGGFLLVTALVLSGAWWSAWGLIFVGLGLLIFLTYFLFASLWRVYICYDLPHQRPSRWLVALGQIRPQESIMYVDFGQRLYVEAFMHALTGGKLTVIDVYDPLLVPHSAVARRRDRAMPAQRDPRLVWRSGDIDLLPVRDISKDAAVLTDTLLWLRTAGDRRKLLDELYRVLKPGGRLLVMAPLPTQQNRLVWGWRAWSLMSVAEWRQLFKQAGFSVAAVQTPNQYMHYFLLEKPALYRKVPLPLNLYD